MPGIFPFACSAFDIPHFDLLFFTDLPACSSQHSVNSVSTIQCYFASSPWTPTGNSTTGIIICNTSSITSSSPRPIPRTLLRQPLTIPTALPALMAHLHMRYAPIKHTTPIRTSHLPRATHHHRSIRHPNRLHHPSRISHPHHRHHFPQHTRSLPHLPPTNTAHRHHQLLAQALPLLHRHLTFPHPLHPSKNPGIKLTTIGILTLFTATSSTAIFNPPSGPGKPEWQAFRYLTSSHGNWRIMGPRSLLPVL